MAAASFAASTACRRDRPVTRQGRAAGHHPGTGDLLGHRLRLARVRGEAECAAAVHDRDRRLDIHFIHVRSRTRRAPLIITHGWPGSVIELLEIIGPLTDPTAHGGRAEDAFDLVLPSCPATASRPSRPRSAGIRPHRPGVGGTDAPPRLRPLRRPGRRLGAGVTDAVAFQAPAG